MLLKKYYQQNKDLLNKETNGEIVIVDRKSGKYTKLTDVSALIWKALEKKQSFDEILKKILSNYQIDKESAQKDLSSFLDQAIKNKIVLTIDK